MIIIKRRMKERSITGLMVQYLSTHHVLFKGTTPGSTFAALFQYDYQVYFTDEHKFPFLLFLYQQPTLDVFTVRYDCGVQHQTKRDLMHDMYLYYCKLHKNRSIYSFCYTSHSSAESFVELYWYFISTNCSNLDHVFIINCRDKIQHKSLENAAYPTTKQ